MVHVELGEIVPLFSVTEVPPLTAVTEAEPPHPVRVGATGLARKTLAGRLSVSVVWVRVVLRSLFLITIDSWLVPPTQMGLGVKLLVTEGGWIPVTFKVALAGVVFEMFTPPPVEVNAPAGIVLIRFPVVVEVTLIDTVHAPGVTPDWAGTVPPLKDKVVDPATAVTEPPHELVNPTGLAMESPGCTPIKLSIHAALVNGNIFGLKIVTFRRDTPPAAMDIGEKLLFISAGKDGT